MGLKYNFQRLVSKDSKINIIIKDKKNKLNNQTVYKTNFDT